jgi:YVTN family beta-propeller protein
MPPAGVRPALVSAGAAILPGGRIVAPAGGQFPTGAGPFALALSASGKTLVTGSVAGGSLTVVEKGTSWEIHHIDLGREPEAGGGGVGISAGIAFSGEHAAFVSESNSQRVALIDLETGDQRRTIDLNQRGDLNQSGFADSSPADLAFDQQRDILYIADIANGRVAIADTHTRRMIASVKIGFPPLALGLSQDRRKLYAAGPGSVAVIDLSEPVNAKVEAAIPIGRQDDLTSILEAGGHAYVADATSDSIIVIDTRARRVESQIPIRIPGLEQLRGILPSGLAFYPKSGWLLVAESGINAVGVIDTAAGKVLGHIPAGWYPTRVAIDHDTVYVANLRGDGAGPRGLGLGDRQRDFREGRGGSLSIYAVPSRSELVGDTESVLRDDGLEPRPREAPGLPGAIRHVVLIVKGRRSFDEMLGDLIGVRNGSVMAAPILAHLGTRGFADGGRKQFSLQQVNLTPNHHAIAQQWAFSDNFYADSALESDGLRRLFGSYPQSWIEPPQMANRSEQAAGMIWEQFASRGISFEKFDEGSNEPLSDTERAAQFAAEIERRFGKTGTDLPQFLYLHLPNDSLSEPQPDRGYPYPESGVADNDNALGQVLEYLSKTRWWKQMVVFVAEAAGSGLDHIDPRRIVLLCAGPWVKRNYVSHTNTDFSGLRKTILEIFHMPAMTLFDAAAADLSDCFASTPDYAAYQSVAVDARIFDSKKEEQ